MLMFGRPRLHPTSPDRWCGFRLGTSGSDCPVKNPVFHVSQLKPFHSPVSPVPTEPGTVDEPPLPPVEEDGGVFSVKEILDSRRRGGRIEYLVDWDGFGPEERSWVHRDDILDPTLLTDFHAQHPGRPTPRSRGRPP